MISKSALYCHVDKATGKILSGPSELPHTWGNVSGLPYLPEAKQKELGWYRVKMTCPSCSKRIKYTYDPDGDVVVGSVSEASVAQAKQRVSVQLGHMMQANLLAGFRSSATGNEYIYIVDQHDQMNLNSAVALGIGMSIHCLDAEKGEKSLYIEHDAEQIRRVLQDYMVFRGKQLAIYRDALETLRYASTLEEVVDSITPMEDWHLEGIRRDPQEIIG